MTCDRFSPSGAPSTRVAATYSRACHNTGSDAGAQKPSESKSKAMKASASVDVQLPPGESPVYVLVKVPPGAAELWWPNGYGTRTLYNMTASFLSAGLGLRSRLDSSSKSAPVSGQASAPESSVTSTTGFRTVDLVQEPIPKPLVTRSISAVMGWTCSPSGRTGCRRMRCSRA